MAKDLGWSPVAALAMARTMRRIAVKYDDPDLLERAEKLEAEAQDEINKQRLINLGLTGNA
jgi:hypothetical protein